MQKIDFTEQELMQEVQEFLNDFVEFVVSPLIWKERAEWLLQFEEFPSQSSPNDEPHTEPFAAIVMPVAYELAISASWDEAKGKIDEFMGVVETIWELHELPAIGKHEKIGHVARIALARWHLESGMDLNLEEIAILADMSLGSVKNAIYSTGSDRLAVQDGSVDNKVASAWLANRRGFKPIKFYNSRFSAGGYTEQLESLDDIGSLIKWRSQALKIDKEQLIEALDLQDRRALLDVILRGLPFYLEDILNVDTCVRLAILLKLDPKWFASKSMELLADCMKKEFIAAREQEIREKLASPDLIPQDHGHSALEFDCNIQPTDKIVRSYLSSREGLRPHPKFRPGNAKMDCYLADNGRAIAHEHNLQNQYLWVDSTGLPEAILTTAHRQYPAVDRSQDEKYGRHSGLLKYPELAEAPLAKFQPRTMEEVYQLVDAVLAANSIQI